MATFEIQGGTKLSGVLQAQGAKNEALQIICASLLSDEKVTIHNIPEIRDVLNLIELLQHMGSDVKKLGTGSWSFKADSLDIDYLHTPEFSEQATRLRGSVMIIGPLLARFGEAVMPQPGGDKIGRRRLDTHFNGFIGMGAEVNFIHEKSFFHIKGKKLKESRILLDEASVTGTANLIMAATLTQGKTVLYNAACEPYVQQLCKMLISMGASIKGIGSNLLEIEGVNSLGGTEHRILPDMIEVGSFIGMAAMTGSSITLPSVSIENLGIIPKSFMQLGIEIQQIGDDLFIPEHDNYTINSFMDGSILTIADAPWPGLTPDLLSVFLVVATQAKGSVLIHQKMFESRLFFVDKLIDMGAQIILCDPHRATVIGLNRQFPLRATTMTSPDIRAGVALLIAAMCAEGTSIIHNIEQIDRGYQNIDQRLNALGAQIKRL
ncbi:MAG: UDP-N-acetylglucosamine 1-carboxyvinyltransferase [Bacteroidetes bacterium]|jgi:UDP-N-acetylglucosamine 1-carboxyvinyltransferase|nr:UDP-N-acetylglucosamine 1-carboxyvinyltransferase [Bacteroidota bacterium]MBT3751054.1 UDP-N-acetylglucosamine 1-carboxyvinyltransferase [Bacteroidota bacterium]MBT4400178.1 UDP-N-acetylglucosamine 1-carboxyvinyltransferase [Bacteroidota bacterium]MBT5426827.1 UDP-N-acetylglucosamine 1-carboxyvinyltransferase [Bacteroidota bacterium]MBT7092884.1 UDP-N-acetylglucosamine 1-carboxyvinyltransferase [Bacteroidota bacterium]